MVSAHKIYALQVDYDNFKSFIPSDLTSNVRCKGQPLNWSKPLSIEVDEDDMGMPEADISLLNIGSFVVSENLKDELFKSFDNDCEYLPLQLQGRNYYLVNVINVIDCLDKNASKFNEFGGVSEIVFDNKSFCCNGCKTVYEIFSANDLTCYYDLQQAPGATPKDISGKYNFLDNQKIVEQLLEFNDGTTQIVTLYIPHIHCSSCIWVLENLNKLNPSISSSIVNFGKKTARITFNSTSISLKNLIVLLSSIGYEPYISLEDYSIGKKQIDRSLIYKLGVAGFAFGNVMFLSFPENYASDC